MTAGKKPDKIGLSGFPAPYKSNASPGSCGYVHSADTGLYYLQSRYYNPAIGRFINADALVSTGQGVLGNNMFTYCLNNPVAYSDSQGTDAKVCFASDGTIDEIPWWDHSPGGGGFVYHCANITTQYDGDKFLTQIALRHVGNFFEALWEAYVHSNELQVQQQYQQDMLVIKTAEFVTEHPLLAVDIVAASVGVIGICCWALPLAGVAVPVALSGAITIAGHASTLWGVYRTFSGAWNEWQAFIEEG